MGFLKTIRSALALPAAAALTDRQVVGKVSPFSPTPGVLSSIVIDDRIPLDKSMNRQLAMSIPALNRARRLICGTIARCPLEAHENGDVLESQPVWLDRTDGPVSPFHRILWTVDDLLFFGWSLWAVERSPGGDVLQVDRVPYEMWNFDRAGNILWNGKLVNSKSVCLIPGLDAGILEDSSPIIEQAVEINRATLHAARTPGTHTELHQLDGDVMNQDEIVALLEGWVKGRKSTNGAVSFTNKNIEVRDHDLTGIASSFLVEARQAAAMDIARATGIPAVLLDAATADGNNKYSNIQARNQEFIDFGLAPLMNAISARLGMDDMLPSGIECAFNVSELTDVANDSVSTQGD